MGKQLFGQRYETQPYTALGSIGELEIRFYPPSIKALTLGIKGKNHNFSKLFNYIAQGNTSGTKIAMTTPVYLEDEKGLAKMAFVLPQKYLHKKAPTPLCSDIKIATDSGGYFAALRFGGFNTQRKTDKQLYKLRCILKKKGIGTKGTGKILGYNSPFTLVCRRNEVLFEVERKTLPTSILYELN
ncbi:MAG: SOUL family heme-binding protein [Flavobacteriaceae bacterium]